MKSLTALAPICAFLFLTACSQSPERLLEAGNKYHRNKKYKEASILYRKAIAKDKTNAEAYYREGLNLLDQNSPVEASKFLRRAVDLNADNVDAETRLAEIYLAAYATEPKKLKGLLPDVRELTLKILHHDPNSFDGVRLQAMMDLADNKPEPALENFARANQIRPYSREVVGWYAQTLAATNRTEEAKKLVRGMIDHDKTWGAAYDFLYVQYIREGDTAKAEAVLRERLHNDPKSAVAVTNLSNYLLGKGRGEEAQATIQMVLNNRKDFPNAREMAGDFYYRAKKFDDAYQQYLAGSKEDSKNSLHYQQRMIGALSILGRRDEAMNLARDMAARNPKDTLSNQIYASMLLDSGLKTDVGKSVAELKKLVQSNGNDAILRLDLSRAYFGLGDMDKSMAEAQEAIRIQGNLMPARLIMARILEDRRQHAKALEQTEVILNTEPKNADARLVRDRAMIGLNQPMQAQPDLEALIQEYPAMNDARVELGGVYLRQGQFAKAAGVYEAAWKSDPPDGRGFIGLQNVKLNQGKGDEAIQAVKDLVAKNPKKLNYRYILANFEATTGALKASTDPSHARELFADAAENYKEILKTNANSGEAWLRLGVMQRQLGQTDPALASFEQASNADPGRPEPLLNRAMLLEGLGKKMEARDAYNKVLGVDPENSIALNNLAFLTADMGDNLDQAMTLAQRAKKKLPNSASVSDTLGYVYYRKNLNSEAVRIFREIVHDEPRNPTFHLHLAMALLKQGDKQAARQEAERALQNASQSEEQNKIKTFVNQIG